MNLSLVQDRDANDFFFIMSLGSGHFSPPQQANGCIEVCLQNSAEKGKSPLTVVCMGFVLRAAHQEIPGSNFASAMNLHCGLSQATRLCLSSLPQLCNGEDNIVTSSTGLL